MSEAAIDPRANVTPVAIRQRIVALDQAGLTYGQIAERVGCSRWTVGRWVRTWRREEPARLEPRAHRPHRVHPQTTAPWIQERIRAIRQTHPGWGHA